MMKAAGVVGFLALTTVAHADDPVQTDGNKYKVKIENERVRVLEYKTSPARRHTSTVTRRSCWWR